MISETTLIISIVTAVFASTGFWAFITFLIQRKDKKESTEGKMLRGLGHDRICMTICTFPTKNSAVTVRLKKS